MILCKFLLEEEEEGEEYKTVKCTEITAIKTAIK